MLDMSSFFMQQPQTAMAQYYPSWLGTILTNILTFLHIQVMGPDGVTLTEGVQVAYTIIWAVILFTMIAVVAQAAVIFMVLMERKVLAWLTQRKGPNRVGPWGLLQTLADGVKLLFKEDIMHSAQDKLLFVLGPAIFFLPCFVFYGLIPFTDQILGVAIPAGALLVFALSSISVIGIVLSGWASNNKYSLLGGMRSAAQAISYEIPLILSVLAVVLYSGTMNLRDIVDYQFFSPFSDLSQKHYIGGDIANMGQFIQQMLNVPQWSLWKWNVLVILPVSFAIFFTAAIAEVNRIPFDLPEAESELVSGYNTEYSGMKFALFFLAEYAALFAMCALTVTFFFGGYHSLFGFYIADTAMVRNALGALPVQGLAELLKQTEMLTWFMGKTYVFIFIAMWWRATLPRLKPDQLMGFSWKFLLPLALVNLFVITFQRYWRIAWPEVGQPPIFTPTEFVVWLVIAVVAFGGFFILSSNLLNQKLEARLGQRGL